MNNQANSIQEQAKQDKDVNVLCEQLHTLIFHPQRICPCSAKPLDTPGEDPGTPRILLEARWFFFAMVSWFTGAHQSRSITPPPQLDREEKI